MVIIVKLVELNFFLIFIIVVKFVIKELWELGIFFEISIFDNLIFFFLLVNIFINCVKK